MDEHARFPLTRKSDLKCKLQENRKKGESEYVLSKKALRGFKKEPYRYQLHDAFKAVKLRNSASKGAILVVEKGLGKTSEALIVINFGVYKRYHWGISGTPWTMMPGQLERYVNCLELAERIKDPLFEHSTLGVIQALHTISKAMQKKGPEASMQEVQQIVVATSIVI
jgi:hypothetical protein